MRLHVGICPICGAPATMSDWRPKLDWVVVEECCCDGFFVQGALLDRLFGLTSDDREDLRRRIRQSRAKGHYRLRRSLNAALDAQEMLERLQRTGPVAIRATLTAPIADLAWTTAQLSTAMGRLQADAPPLP